MIHYTLFVYPFSAKKDFPVNTDTSTHSLTTDDMSRLVM